MKNDFNEKEVIRAATAVIDNLVKYTPQKDLEKLLMLYDESPDFQFIDNDGVPKGISQLKELYTGLFSSLDYIKILESDIRTTAIDSETAYCVWKGKEKIKMLESEAMESSWIATIIVKKIEDNWKIIHFHATHF